MMDYPKVIEVQFHNKCNSNCLICPYKDMNYSYKSMTNELFEKLLSEIDEKKLKRIIPYLNNEPFLDVNFIEKVKKIRNKFKKIEIEISSNVSMIKEKDIIALNSLNITELRLSVFGYEKDTYNKMMPCLNYEKTFEKLKTISNIMSKTSTIISIVMIDTGEISEQEFIDMEKMCKSLGFNFERWGFLDRSDNVTYKSNNIYNENVSYCEQNRPLERMHILSDGRVIFCCQDWSHSLVVGDINNNTISEVWNSKVYNNARNSLYDKEKDSPMICKKCKLGH
ncbi:radical SAM domain protein [Clostridium sp. CAG:710]|nr:radical SAM domain protein [Clostridium sp. CAG:710]